MAEKQYRPDPFRGAFFRLEIGNIVEAEFSECSGLSSESEVVTYEEGGENTFVHKFRGRNKYPNLVLRHGLSRMSPAIWAWREAVIYRKTPPMVNGSIVLIDDQGKEVSRWTFRNGWPCKWQGPDLKAGDDAIAIEVLEIAHDGFIVQVPQK